LRLSVCRVVFLFVCLCPARAVFDKPHTQLDPIQTGKNWLDFQGHGLLIGLHESYNFSREISASLDMIDVVWMRVCLFVYLLTNFYVTAY